MIKMWITVPHCVGLTREEAWERCDTFQFSVCRGHYLLIGHSVPGPIRLGEIVNSNITPRNTMDERIIEVKQEYSILQIEETIKQALATNELTTSIVSSLSLGLKKGPANISHTLKGELAQKLTTSFQKNEKIHETVTARACSTFTRKLQINPEERGRAIHEAYGFQRYAYDVYLVFLDFLNVYYLKSPYGLRRKMRKWPRADDPDHSNIVPLRSPIGSFHFWKLLPDLQTVDESRYELQVKEPFEVEVLPIAKPRTPAVEYPRDEPTLYQISRAAFPFKWIQRGEWTREELLAIEREEAELDGVWWRWQDGPKKLRRTLLGWRPVARPS